MTLISKKYQNQGIIIYRKACFVWGHIQIVLTHTSAWNQNTEENFDIRSLALPRPIIYSSPSNNRTGWKKCAGWRIP